MLRTLVTAISSGEAVAQHGLLHVCGGTAVAPASLGDPTAQVVPAARLLHPGDQVAHLALPHSQPSHTSPLPPCDPLGRVSRCATVINKPAVTAEVLESDSRGPLMGLGSDQGLGHQHGLSAVLALVFLFHIT